MKRRKKRPPRPPLAGAKPVNVKLPIFVIKTIDALWAARRGTEGLDPKKSGIYMEVLLCGLESFDLKTGRRKPPPLDGPAPVSPVIDPAHQPVFQESVYRFATDADLHRAMNRSETMLWAAGADNACQHVNPAVEEYTGATAAQFLRLGWVEFIHPDDREKTLACSIKGFQTHQPFHMRYRFRCKDGAYGWFSDNVRPRYYPDGRFAGYVGAMQELVKQSDPESTYKDVFNALKDGIDLAINDGHQPPVWIECKSHSPNSHN